MSPRDEDRESAARTSGNWRKSHPGYPGALRRRWIMHRMVQRERRAFRQATRLHILLHRFAALGNRLIDSWLVLVPLGLICVWAVLYRAGWFR